MLRVFIGTLVCVCTLLLAANVTASGPTGVHAVIEKVVFEPTEQNPERIQIWGAFSFVDGGISRRGVAGAPERGYLYFSVPSFYTEQQSKVVRTEWLDLKAIAGTGQAVAFGDWGYIGVFSPNGGNQVHVTVPAGGRGYRGIRLQVLNASSTNAEPVPYASNTGIVKLPAEGSHTEIVKRLRESLRN